jgi:Flp pilus assembly protein TadG
MAMHARLRSARGQSIVEMAIILPILCVMVLGVVELSYALLHQHVVTRLTREGSNLISRDTSLQDAATAMVSMSSAPVNFASNSTLIFSVVKRVATVGSSNYNKDVLYARYQYGVLSATSALQTRGSGSFGSPPDYEAANSDNDTSLQLTNLPTNLNTTGGMLYVTEIYTTHTLITPLNRFGVSVPTQLYSIAYF